MYESIKSLNDRINNKTYKKDDIDYFEFLRDIEKSRITSTEIIFNYPIYQGKINLARYLQFYELFKSVDKLSGHIADVGTYKGSTLFYFSKLIQIFEPNSLTKVFGFDWFKGMKTKKNDNIMNKGLYQSSYSELLKNIKKQKLDEIITLVKLDLAKQIKIFFKKNPWLRFRFVFIDCGIENVLKEVLPVFWKRLVNGGVMIFDHYNHPISPTESNLVDQLDKKNFVRRFKFSNHPTAFVYKKKN